MVERVEPRTWVVRKVSDVFGIEAAQIEDFLGSAGLIPKMESFFKEAKIKKILFYCQGEEKRFAFPYLFVALRMCVCMTA